MWMTAAGVTSINVTQGPRFTVENMAIEAAKNGVGVALVSHSAVADDLASGRLVRPFDLTLRTDIGYWLVCPPENARKAKVQVFCDWILAEIAKENAPIYPDSV